MPGSGVLKNVNITCSASSYHRDKRTTITDLRPSINAKRWSTLSFTTYETRREGHATSINQALVFERYTAASPFHAILLPLRLRLRFLCLPLSLSAPPLPGWVKSISPRKCRSFRELQMTSRIPTVCKPSSSHSSSRKKSIAVQPHAGGGANPYGHSPCG